jgi:hypothetical protein
MLVKVGPNRRPHWVKDEIDSLAARQFCGGHKIRITGNQNELVDLPLIGEGCYVKPDAHIDALLAKVKSKIMIADAHPLALAVDQRLERILGKLPAYLCRRYVAEAKGDLP